MLKTVGEIPQWLSDRMMESDDPPPCLMAAHMILVHEMTRMIREANTLQAGKRAKWMDNPPAEIPHDVHVEMTGPREGR